MKIYYVLNETEIDGGATTLGVLTLHYFEINEI